jgi:hypothetical protein
MSRSEEANLKTSMCLNLAAFVNQSFPEIALVKNQPIISQ